MISHANVRSTPRAGARTLLILAAIALSIPALAYAGSTGNGDPLAGATVETIADTLTVIQRPLLNIPALVTPGGSFTINCDASSATTGWGAELIHGALHVPLTISGAAYNASTLWWGMTATVPAGILDELYDLQVTADGGIADVVKHAVKVLPAFKTSYYFIQVTDSHLPTHLNYGDPGVTTDSTSTLDFRAVVDDINIINPEFVLHTGDLVNEGEMEDYQNYREYSRSKRLLGELQVPVFLSSGNHDLGGWPSNPPPAGTARKNWWRFFGWKRLANPPAGAPARTQDYSFDYGPIHFTALEAYIAYDDYLPLYYGAQSFTSAQLSWLTSDLAAAAGSTSQVLFYHYDFSSQINLGTRGVEMALWGHIHSNSGSLTTQPYNLGTMATVDGKRAYRMIRVNNGVVTPLATLQAGSTGQNLTVAYSPANNGTNMSVSAIVTNNTAVRFENGLLKFVMPKVGGNVQVVGGSLLQTDDSGPYLVCYVGVDLLANASHGTSVTIDMTAVGDSPAALPRLAQNRPNPFNPRTDIAFDLPRSGHARLAIYAPDGRRIATLVDGDMPAGPHTTTWDGRDDRGRAVPSGTYFYRLETADGAFARRLSLVR